VGRTNIDIDDELVDRVMRRYGLRTKKDAVDFALRHVSAAPMTPREMHAMRGSGWEGDLDGTRRGEAEELAGQWPAGPAPRG
jgi:Arc/MetJ family transcription regulator